MGMILNKDPVCRKQEIFLTCKSASRGIMMVATTCLERGAQDTPLLIGSTQKSKGMYTGQIRNGLGRASDKAWVVRCLIPKAHNELCTWTDFASRVRR